MKNGNAYSSIRKNVRVPHFIEKNHSRRHIGIIFGEIQFCLK